MKIQKVFRHAITLTIVKVEKALKDNVLDVTVKPSLIGTIAKLDVNRLVIKAYQQALKSLPAKSNFTFRSTVTLRIVGQIVKTSILRALAIITRMSQHGLRPLPSKLKRQSKVTTHLLQKTHRLYSILSYNQRAEPMLLLMLLHRGIEIAS